MKSNPLTIVAVIGGFAAALYATLDVMTGMTGPLAIAARWIGITLVLISFLRPKAGLVLLSVVCFYGDFYKKLAVCYGSGSFEAVIEVLAVNMAMVGAIIAGSVVQMRAQWPQKSVMVTLLISVVAAGMCMLTNGALAARGQLAVNGALYFGLAAIIAHQYPQPGSSLKLSRFQYLLGIPWVVVACWQYFFGFSEMDLDYATTFFSPVYSSQFFMENPRVFGLAGSASAYGAIIYCFIFGLWALLSGRGNRFLYIVGSLIYLAGLIVSTQRTILLMPIIVLLVTFMFQSAGRTRLFYILLVSITVVLISSSGFLLNSISDANESLINTTGGDGWASRVVRVGTFSDRLKGWTRLTKPETYSWFGSGGTEEGVNFADEEFSHDATNSILKNYGVVGLGLALAAVLLALRAMHRAVLQTTDQKDRQIMTFVTATLCVTLTLTAGGGSNLHTVPFNLLLATLLGHALAAMNRRTAALNSMRLAAQAAPRRAGPWRVSPREHRPRAFRPSALPPQIDRP